MSAIGLGLTFGLRLRLLCEECGLPLPETGSRDEARAVMVAAAPNRQAVIDPERVCGTCGGHAWTAAKARRAARRARKRGV